MIKFTKYVKVSSLEEAYELNKSRANVIMGGMMWLGMQNRNIGTVCLLYTSPSPRDTR